MSTRRKSFRAPVASSSRSNDNTEASLAVPGVKKGRKGDEGLDEVRARWVRERQTELDRITDAHDTMVRPPILVSCAISHNMQVREAFHLEKFVSLLTYDPKVRTSPPPFRVGTSYRASLPIPGRY